MVPTYLEKPKIRPEQRKLPQIRPENRNPEKRPGICCHIYVFGGIFQDIWLLYLIRAGQLVVAQAVTERPTCERQPLGAVE